MPAPANGSIKIIYDKFFRPMVKRYKQDDQEIIDFLADLFGVDHCYIDKWCVNKPFKMPGLLLMSPYVKVQGYGNRSIKQKDYIWSRVNLKEPNVVHVEVYTGRGQKEQVFELSELEWEKVKLSLNPLTSK